MQEKIEYLTKLFEQNRNEANAVPMKKYMKEHFLFLGIKAPLRRKLENQFFIENGILKEPFNKQFVAALWEKNEREYQYAALDYMEKSLKKLARSDLGFMETLITTKSWWDTVDVLSPKLIGSIARKYPDVILESINKWASHDNLWLRRATILFQLKYKEETNEEILYQYILKNAESKEFFIQKAVGWALREYSKTNPASVKHFIENHQLAPLSIREGSKYLS